MKLFAIFVTFIVLFASSTSNRQSRQFFFRRPFYGPLRQSYSPSVAINPSTYIYPVQIMLHPRPPVNSEQKDTSSNSSSVFCQHGVPYVPSEDNTLIEAGVPVVEKEFPWLVALFKNSKQFCGGSVINERWILTAAHCLVYRNNTPMIPSSITVVAGDYDIYNDADGLSPQKIKAESISVYPGFKLGNLNGDIALIKLTSPLKFNEYIQPICIAPTSKNFIEGQMATVAGWGLASKNPQRKPLKTTIPLVSRDKCPKVPSIVVTNNMFCSGTPNGSQSPCNGDSGSPLIIRAGKNEKGAQRWEQIGVVSWGINCKGVSVYTRLYEQTKWITSVSGLGY